MPKSTKNAPRITPEATKMAVLPLSWSISELMLSHLGSPAHHLASLVRHLGANMCNNLKQKAFGETTSAKTAPRCLSHTFPAPQKYQKPKKTSSFSKFFTLQPWCQNQPKMLPEPPQKLPSRFQNGNLAPILVHLMAYDGSSWRSCSPSCLSCSPSRRQHVQQFEA